MSHDLSDSGDLPDEILYAKDVKRQNDHIQIPDGNSIAANIASVKMTQSIGDLIDLASKVDQSDPFKKYILEKGQHDFRFQRASFDNQVVMSRKVTKIALASMDSQKRLDEIDENTRKREIENAYTQGQIDHEKREIAYATEAREKRLKRIATVCSFGSPIICGVIWLILSYFWQKFFPEHPMPNPLPGTPGP